MKRLLWPLFFIASVCYADPIGVVNAAKAPAHRMEAGADTFHTAEAKEGINWGDSLKTGISGLLGILFFEDGSQVKLTGNTAVQLITPDAGTGKRSLDMKIGSLWAKIVQTEIGLDINTPSAVASVKGTRFWMMVDPNGNTRVLCQQGLLSVTNKTSGVQTFVPAGEMCLAGIDGSMETIKVNPEEGIEPEEPERSEEMEEGAKPTGPDASSPTMSPTPSIQPSRGEGFGLGVNGAAGVASINKVNYQYISLRPDISFWKFGIGLDLPFYFDSEGNLREEDWNGLEDVATKIFYLRYGKPDDNFYVRGGALSPITLGYGLIMRRYTNAIQWPQVRRIGLQSRLRYGNLTFEGLLNNFNELQEPGLLGGRMTYETKLILPVVFGGTAVYDGNQYLGVEDEDDDGVPDMLDMFPGRNDFTHIDRLWKLDSLTIDSLIAWGDLPNIYNRPDNFKDLTESVLEVGFDVGVPIIRREKLNLWLYAQYAQINGYGWGIGAPGARLNMGPLTAGLEYRRFEKEFMGDFFDLSYEVERIVWDEETQKYLTKKARLRGIQESTNGYFIDLGFNFFNLIEVFGAYQCMLMDIGPDLKSVYARGSLNTEFIPKVTLAEAYYNQPNAENFLDNDADGTILGYRVGIGLGGGVSLIFDNKTIYYNGKPNRITTIETAFTF